MRRFVRCGHVRPLLFAGAGAVLAVALAGRVDAVVGPFDCTVTARPGLSGSTVLQVAPLGSIVLDTHTSPVTIELRVEELRADDAKRFVAEPALLEGIEDEVAADARAALRSLAVKVVLVSIAGGLLGALAARVAWRDALIGALAGLLLAGGALAASVATFRPEAVAEPRYSGLLSSAPRAVGNVATLLERFDDYRAQLTGLVGNVVQLYQAAEGLPVLETGDDAVRVLHISDIHNNPQGFDLAEQLVAQFDIDAVVDTGDTSDWGTEPETRLLGRIGDLGVPYVWVRGNHDSRRTQRAVAAQPNAVVLDGDAATVAGLRFWGIGDPRYTPDKDQPTGHDVEAERIERFTLDVDRSLGESDPSSVDVALVHDSRAAALIGDDVPLILAGHIHAAREDRIGEARLMVEGSTGGAGLRALEGEEPEPLACTVMYFDPATDRLVAYDRIIVDGFGGTGARIERHVVAAPDEDDEEAAPGS
jgi:predicted phosphodiesterase